MMRTRNFLILLVFIFLFYLWNFRGYYIPTFDAGFMNDYYDRSQWVVPQSVRVMGDEARYEVAAYRLMRGGDLYEVAPEVPSVGKYLFGISQLLFGRSIVIIAIIFALTVYGFYLLTGQFFDDQRKRQLATLLFVLTPNVVLSLQRVTLDLMQVCALIFHIYFLLIALKSENKKAWILIGLSGLFSGLFVSVKFGLFILPVLVADGVLLFLHKRLRYWVAIVALCAAVYVMSTAAFFVDGRSIVEWVQAQKWVANFYLSSNNGFVPGMGLLTIVTSMYRGWWGDGWESSEDWSVLMSAGFAVLLFFLYRLRKNMKMPDESWLYGIVFSGTTVLLLSVIAFWPRYLLMVTPFFVLFVVKFLFEHRIAKIVAVLFFVILIGQTVWLFYPQPYRTIAGFRANFESGLFQDVYLQLSAENRPTMSASEFWKKNVSVRDQLVVYESKVAISERFVWPWETVVTLPMQVSYQTDIGRMEHKTDMVMRRENGKWMIDWRWNYVLQEYDIVATIEKMRIDAQEGELRLDSGRILSYGGNRTFIYAMPEQVDDYEKLEYLVAPVINEKRYMISKKLKENSPADRWVGLGFAWPGNNVSEVCSNRAILCIDIPDRIISEEFIKAGKVERIINLENKYSERLWAQHGGMIILHFPDGTEKEIYSRPVRVGEEVVISESDILEL
jgi:Dolichyl-phosphate-mannose-protein mannosyltransferase